MMKARPARLPIIDPRLRPTLVSGPALSASLGRVAVIRIPPPLRISGRIGSLRLSRQDQPRHYHQLSA